MKCKYCGYETNSEKIFYSHENSCLKVQEENGLTTTAATRPEEMSYQELRKLAAEKGIDLKKKEEILQALKELEANSNGNNNSGEGKDGLAGSGNGEGSTDK
jgi:hypothetical protein